MKYPLLTFLAFVSVLSATARAADANRLPSVDRVSIVSQNPFQIRIQTSAETAPMAQMIEQPERLVIDLPNTRPGAGLRKLNVNQGAVRSIRASLYSAKPPVTRVVVDLTLPQWYRIVPDASGVVVTIGGGADAPSDPGSTVGWVSTKSPAQRVSSARTTQTQMPSSAPRPAVPVNGVTVEFVNGQLTIRAKNSTLSEVLYQIQKKTGAEIAIPSGTEQDKVAADFGPGTPSEVLSQLLNGSGLNFVVVGSESDPKALRSVLLSRKGPDLPDMPQQYNPPVAQNMPMEAPDPSAALPGPEAMQQQNAPEITAPQQNPDGTSQAQPQDVAPGN